MMLPAAYVGHGMAQRTRVKIPARRGDADCFQRLQAALQAHPAVAEVSANPLTASLLVRHDIALAELAAFAEEKELFSLAGENPVGVSIAGRLGDMARALDRELRQASGGAFDGMEAALLLLVALGLYQLWRGRVLPPASALFGYAIAIAAAARSAGETREPEHGGAVVVE